jgi:hypothetical protein
MKKIIYAILLVFLLTFAVAAQAERVLHVEVEDGKTLDLYEEYLPKFFPRREVKAKAHDGKDAIYSGYNLSDILLYAGAKIGKDKLRGKEIGSYLVVEAADGYKAIFAIAEVAPEFTDKLVLLADMRDGQHLDLKQGHWQIVLPDDKKHGRWVRQVTALKIKKAQ